MNYCTTIPTSRLPAVKRIVAVGDIHGDWRALKSVLILAHLTNKHNEWTGGETHAVFVGDLLDRGGRSGSSTDEKSESIILEHLVSLREAARKAGGEVHLLLGNHELMNVQGDFRYVSPLGMHDFGGDRRAHFKPGAQGARFLACNMNSVVQIGSWIFSHAGITHNISKTYTIDQVNNYVRDFLLGNRQLDEHLVPLFWHRDYSTAQACPRVADALGAWDAKRMAIGHTVYNNVHSICQDSLWKLDIGMSDAFGKSSSVVSVLEIIDDGEEVNILKGPKQSR